jgi:hypothetical protein
MYQTDVIFIALKTEYIIEKFLAFPLPCYVPNSHQNTRILLLVFTLVHIFICLQSTNKVFRCSNSDFLNFIIETNRDIHV